MLLIFSRYVLRRLAVAVGLALIGLGLVVLPPLFLSALSKLGGVGLGTVLGYLPLVSSELLPYLVPVGFLLAVIGTFSALAARKEWTAIQMAGLHPFRVVLPALGLAAAFSAVAFVSLHEVVPSLRKAQADYRVESAVAVVRTLLRGKTAIQLGEFAIVGRRRRGDVFEDVVLRVPGTDSESSRNILARSLEIADEGEGLRIRLRGARILEQNQTLRLDRMEIFLPLDRIVRVRRPDPDKPTFLTSRAILHRLSDADLDESTELRLRYELRMRTALSTCYLIFVLLGIPTGLRLSSESMLAPLGWTMLYACAYYVVFQRVGREMALSGKLPIWVATWLANVLGLVGAGFLVAWRRR